VLFLRGRKGGNGVIRGNVTQLENRLRNRLVLLMLLVIKVRGLVCCPR